MSTETDQLQQKLFQHLKTRIPPHVSFVDEISELLNISSDSAYRRIRGEKPITLDELQKLCSRYQVSVDQLLHIQSNTTIFHGQWVDHRTFNFEKYLKDMLLQLEMMNQAGAKKIYYEAKDIPLPHHFQFPELAAFKYFFWMRTILQYPELSKTKFESHELQPVIREYGTKIISAYNKVPSVEIWSAETINSTLRQIDYYLESGVFQQKQTALELFEQLEKLINHIQEEAEHSEKFLIDSQPTGNPGNFDFYFNEVILGHNTILVELPASRMTFINHGVLNYMITYDQSFCENTFEALRNIMRKSLLISGSGEKDRSRFFNLLRDQISKRKQVAWSLKRSPG